MSSIQAVFGLRSQRNTTTITPTINSRIEEFRSQVKAGVDGDGWQRVITGWRNGGSDAKPPAAGKQYSHQRDDRRGGGGGGAPHRSAAAHPPPPHTNPVPPQPYKRYESRFKNTDQDVESTIVNTIILGKLNKFSPQNYNEVYEFLSEILASGECDFLADFMKLIFTKAAKEETFCPLYARLLKELSAKYPFLLSEMDILYKKFLEIFEELDDAVTDGGDDSAINKRKEKKYRLGYSQFLAELLKQDIADTDAFYSTIEQIVRQIDNESKKENKFSTIEEYADCLTKILKVLKESPTDSGETKVRRVKERVRENLRSRIEELSRKSVERPSLNNKVRFAMMDAKDAIN